ncbi:MAG TPA: hypothetical protein VFJ06_04505 [Halococcus sp.]|nr:hypothetical protein [Halococcus sp.]
MSMFDGILNRDAPTDTDADTPDVDPEEIHETASILGEQYPITETSYDRVSNFRSDSVKVTADTETEGLVAGSDVRKLFETARNRPRQALWIGYDNDPQEGFVEGGIPFENLRRHIWIAGVSGAGKTTEYLNIETQLAYGGHGFVYFDPKGRDSRQLLRMLPEDRLDDVIWIEPGGTGGYDKEIGINFLELPETNSEEQRENEVENRVDNLKAIFETEGYINIETITESMGRAMLKSDTDYSIIDLYFILLNQQRREEFAETVEDPYIREFCYEIADMDDDTIRPILKRITSWVQNAVIRRIIACRESTINFREIIEEDKIVVVRTPTTSNDIKKLITLGVMRNIWSAAQRRSYETDDDPKPYFVICDEFDDIASPSLDMESMLARARSMWLGVMIACQYPDQLDEKTLTPIKNNCDNLVSFKANDGDDARILMKRFRGYDADDLIETDDYEVWTKLPIPDSGRHSPPVKLNTFAPYPPLRDEDAIDEIIEDSLDRYGAEPLSDAEIQRELKFGTLGEVTNPEHIDPDNIPPKRLIECVFVAAVNASDDDDGTEAISNEQVHEEFERRTGVEMTQAKFSSALEELYDEELEQVREGEAKVRVSDAGYTKLFQQDTGDAENAGGPEHRYILRECFKTFLGLGAYAYLPSQGGEELPDGVADLPINPLAEAETDAEYQQLKATCKEEYGPLYKLSDGKDIAIEAETTTLKKPKQTLTNLRKAVEQGKKCVFACKDGSYDESDFDDPNDVPHHTSLFQYWGRRGENVIFDTSGRGASVTTDYSELTFVSETIKATPDEDDDEDDEDELAPGRIFYNRGRELYIEPDVGALRRKASKSMQWRERSTGEAATDTEIVMEEKTSNGSIRARFESAEAIFDADREDFPAYYEKTDEGYEVYANGAQGVYDTKDAMTNDFKVIREPFIPKREFVDSSGNTRLPTEDDFVFIIYPDDNNDEYDEPMIYEHGEIHPLVSDDNTNDTGSTSATKSTDTDENEDGHEDGAEDKGTSQQTAKNTGSSSESASDEQVESTEADQQSQTADECRPSDDADATADSDPSDDAAEHNDSESEQGTENSEEVAAENDDYRKYDLR